MRVIGPVCAGVLAWLALAGPASAETVVVGKVRMFPDRPVAWQEHDDETFAGTPATNDLDKLMATLVLRDGLSNEIDRILSLEPRTPALDVNAADEVPCSTWYCARNHLRALAIDDLLATTSAPAPRLPLTILGGKTEGDAPGFIARDAGGHKFVVKWDPAGHLGMTTSSEIVGNALFRAAGYNVPGAYLIDVSEADLRLAPGAVYQVYGVQRRPFTPGALRQMLAAAARLPDGRVRASASPWLEGQLLGAFDMIGTRRGDPNDRIPHQRRRSLRASRLMFEWLSILDAGSPNTLDAIVEVSGRRFVRHSFIDFSCAFGSATNFPQGLHQEGEHLLEVGRTLAALFSLGIYQRPYQRRRAEYDLLAANYPAMGYYPAETFDPESYREEYKNPAFVRLTDRDAYWGAKLVTSFTDAQLAAVMTAARMPEPDAAAALHALEVRRDILGRRYLRTMAAVEAPRVNAGGTGVCFDDVALARGYVAPDEARYQVDALDVSPAGAYVGAATRFEQAASDAHACVPLGDAGPGTGYRVLQLRTRLARGPTGPAQLTRAARVHLRWRAGERRWVVVGLERDE